MTDDPRSRRPRLPVYYRLIRNWPGATGVVIVVATSVTFLFLLLVEIASGETGPYVGFLHYLVLPFFGVVGVAFVGFGWWLNQRRWRGGVRARDSGVTLDLRRAEVQQRVLATMCLVSGALVFALALIGQRAMDYTESNEFCGSFCHSAMAPEYAAYQRSPHASVHCVDCHVGSGARHFIAAKMRGIHQVIAVTTGSFNRPIPTPIANMRAAEDVCESCHWPGADKAQVYRDYSYFSSDGGGDIWKLQMLLNVGGGDAESDAIRGIHWHMNVSHVVEYIARDERRQDIPWIRSTDTDGTVTVFRSTDDPPSAELEAAGEVRTMGCLDCHNRPAHQFLSPVVLINRAMVSGRIDPTIPDIKFTALEALGAAYETSEEAREGIDAHVRGLLEDSYPDEYEEQRPQVDAAIEVLQSLYASHMFPELKAQWNAHLDNSSHWTSRGCHRCHDGLRQSDDGRVISPECTTCHVLIRQGLLGEEEVGWPDGLAFMHPWDYELMDEPVVCSECHDGVLGMGGQ